MQNFIFILILLLVIGFIGNFLGFVNPPIWILLIIMVIFLPIIWIFSKISKKNQEDTNENNLGDSVE